MAYVPSTSTTDPNAPQQPGQLGGAPNAPMNLPPATSSGTSGSAGSLTAPATGTGQGATAVPNASAQPLVQNLGDYLAANAPQAAGMGQQIASNLTAKAGQVTGDIGADLSAIDQQVQASNVTPNPTLVSEAAANPSDFVSTPQNLTDFLAQENANYTGPTSAESTPQWTALSNEVQNAVAGAPDVTKPGGYLALAAGQEQNPTPGMTNLDAALLEETPGAAAPIAAATAPYQALPGQLTTAATAEDAAIAKAQANDAAAKGLIAPAFTTGPNAVVPNFETNLQGELSNEQTGINTYNQQLEQALSAIAPLEQQIGTFTGATGVGFGDVKNPYSPTSAITAAPTEAMTATPQDYAEAAALEQLLGGNLNLPITPATASEAGTAPTVPALSNMGISGLAQEYVNSLVNQGAAAGVEEFTPGQKTGIVPTVADLGKIQDFNPTPQQVAMSNLAQYLQSVNPAAVKTEANTYTGPGGVQLTNPFGGWEQFIENPVAA